MSTFTVTTNCGSHREFSNRADAEEGKRTHRALCEACDEGDVSVDVTPDEPDQATLRAGAGGRTATGGAGSEAMADDADGEAAANGTPDRSTAAGTGDRTTTDGSGTVPDSVPDEMPESVRTDPLDVVPEYMIDYVEGQPAINKRGYAVIANRFDIAVEAEAITSAGETDHEYAEFKATAWRKDEGREHGYTGHATARASEDRPDIADNLNEMAETRAMKRAVAWASGVGILAWEEFASYVDEA